MATTSVPFILSGKYFEIVSQNGSNVEAVCKQCPEGKNKYKGSLIATTNFHKHLKRKHADLLPSFEADLKAEGKWKVRKTQPEPGQASISSIFAKDESKSMSNFDRKIIKFIVNGMHPISIVDEPDFRALFPDHRLYKRETYRDRILTANSEAKQRVIQRVTGLNNMCLTCDIWTCGGMSRSFMGMTCHWITPVKNGVKRESVALACRRFRGSHTFDRIAELINGIMKEYNIPNSKVVKIVTDNASNFAKAFTVYGAQEDEEEEIGIIDVDGILNSSDTDQGFTLPPHTTCASHSLSLICTSDLPKLKFTRLHKSAFSKCYGVWNKISRSTLASEAVKDMTKKSLVTPVKTRWNSLYDSVKDLLLFRNNLEQICKATGTPIFTEAELDFLEAYSACLKPIAEALDRLQGESNTYYGELLPTLLSTREKLAKLVNNPPENSHKLAETILSGLQTRFLKWFELHEDVKDAVVAAISHPFFKLRWVSEEAMVEAIKKIFIDACIEEKETEELPSAVEHPKEYDAAAESFFGFSQSQSQCTGIEVESSETSARQEALNYLLNPKTSFDILDQYPLVKKVFIKFNTALPSSAPVERLFSYSNMILCPNRRRLTDDMFEVLTLLKVNGL